MTNRSATLAAVLLYSISNAAAATNLDLECLESWGIRDVPADSPDNNPRMLVGSFPVGSYELLRGSITFSLEGVPAGSRVVSASLSIFARSAPWAPANPEGQPGPIVIKNAGKLLPGAFPDSWGSFEVPGGDTSGPELTRLEQGSFLSSVAAENLLPSTPAFVSEIQSAIDAGQNEIHLVAYAPDMESIVPVQAGKHFYRLDNDQNLPGTIPTLHLIYAPDTDLDGIDDDWETSFFPNDLTKLANGQDFDEDGLDDEIEFAKNADPTKPDTDEDTLSDGREVNELGTDPTKTDSDGDTLTDNAELEADPYVTDPARADTDGDGLGDNAEIATHFTDPTDSDSDDDTYPDGQEIAFLTLPGDPTSKPGLLERGGKWSVLHVDAGFLPDTIEEVDDILADEANFFASKSAEYDTINFENLVAGDYFDTALPYPLFDQPEEQIPHILRATGTIMVRSAGQTTLGYSTRSNTVLRVDGEILTAFEAFVDASGRTVYLGTLNLAQGSHQIELTQWSQGQNGLYMIAAYQPGEILFFDDRDDFELMPAFSSGTTAPAPLLISRIDHDPLAGTTTIDWPSQVGATYDVRRSTDLINWLSIDDIVATGTTTTYTDLSSPPDAANYRVHKLAQ